MSGDQPDAGDVAAMVERAREALSRRPDDAELRQAYDQLIADRTNGESMAPACARLAAALDDDR